MPIAVQCCEARVSDSNPCVCLAAPGKRFCTAHVCDRCAGVGCGFCNWAGWRNAAYETNTKRERAMQRAADRKALREQQRL
jgi:hypothetical protein